MTHEEMKALQEMIDASVKKAVGAVKVDNTKNEIEALHGVAVQSIMSFQKALENDDDDVMAKFQVALEAYGNYKKEEALSENKVDVEETDKPAFESEKPTKEQVDKKKAVDAFIKRNAKWFNKDEFWTNAAIDMDRRLANNPDWMYESDEDRLKHIEEVIKQKMGVSDKEEDFEIDLSKELGIEQAKREDEPKKPDEELPTRSQGQFPMVGMGSVHGTPGQDRSLSIGKEPLEVMKELGLGDENTIKRFALELKGANNG